MRHFSFRTSDSFEPSLPSVHRPRKDPGTSLYRLLKQINKGLKHHSGGGVGSWGGAGDQRQRCIVKVRYSRGAGSLRAHLSYIQRQGAGKNGERPELFGNSEKSKLTAGEAAKLRHYRLVVSPESAVDFPLQLLAKKLIQRIEYDTGYSLSWVGTIHENTEHTHLHIVISGQDKKGRQVVFSRKYISSQMREHARDILTAVLGDRRPLPEEERLRREIKANRFTSLDEVIQMVGGAGTVSMKSLRSVATPVRADAAIARLKFLEEVGLAHREGRDYTLSPDWEDSLRISRRFVSYLEAAKHIRYTPKSLLRLYSPERDGRIVGRVSALGLIDELSNNNYILVETIDGRAFYIPLYRKPHGISVGQSIALMKSTRAGPSGGESPSLPRRTPSSSTPSMSLLDVRYIKMPDEKLKSEVMRLGKKRSGFGLQLS